MLHNILNYYIMLELLRKNIAGLLTNRKFFIVLALTIIFIIAALYVYNKYVTPRLNAEYVNNKEYVNKKDSDESETATLYFFYTVWCPHCKTAQPVLKFLKEKIGDNKINGVKLSFVDVDCDKDTETADKFKVEGYPTIKLVKGNKIIEYDAKPDNDTLMQFLNTSL
jgi:thiol-disulfide isomerase/thioredoxin